MKSSKYKQYYKEVDYIESLSNLSNKHNYLINMDNPEVYLKRMRHFLDLLGNPDRGLRFIHITGTSGKGTVTNMIHEVINCSGQKVGSFTSPFVTTSIEKIKVNNKYISTTDFVKIVKKLKPFIKKMTSSEYGGVSYFEVFFAISLLYFKQQKCDWVVLEVGLGGRYDATNVIEKPIITAITNIDYDHTDILGKTLTKIARDKSGIIKSDSVFFTSEKRRSVLNIFKNTCNQYNVKFNTIPISKDYMNNNISLVKAISKELGIKDTYINNGISSARLQCRFELIKNNPKIIIDGAHNKAKIKSTLDNLKKIKYNKLHLVLAISQNKDHLAIIKQLIPKADYIYFTEFKNSFRKSADALNLLELSRNYIKPNARFFVDNNSKKALDLAIKNSKTDDVILATGSFFLAGEIRKVWHPEESVLDRRNAFN